MKTLLMNIETEIVNALPKPNGSVGWRVISEVVMGGPGRVQPVNRTAIAKFVMSTDGAQYMATKLQPTLTPFHKEQHRWWANNFQLFWEGAKLLRTTTQIMTVHLDKNWFYCLVLRSFNKMVPYFAVTPTYHNHHAKNSDEKTLYIARMGPSQRMKMYEKGS